MRISEEKKERRGTFEEIMAENISKLMTSAKPQNRYSLENIEQIPETNHSILLWTECLCPSKFTYRSPNLQCDGIWR